MLGLNLIVATADTSQAYCGVMLCVGSSPRDDFWFASYCTKCSNQHNSKGIYLHGRCVAQKMTYTLSVGKPFKYMLIASSEGNSPELS